MPRQLKHSKYVFIFLLLIIIFVSFLILKPFLTPILASFILTYLFYPLYNLLNKLTKQKTISSLITCFIIILIIFIPLIFVTNILVSEALDFYNTIRSTELTKLSDLSKKITGSSVDVHYYISEVLKSATLFLINFASQSVLSIPKLILQFFVMIFLMFYLFKEGPWLIERIKSFVPLHKKDKEDLFKEIANVSYATLYGLVVTAIIQGIIAGIGYYVFNIPSALLWGIVTAIVAMLPIVGTALVWVPIGVFQLLSNNLYSGVGILLYGTIVISTIDNIVRPKIIGKHAKIHPAIILLGIVGGIPLFGFIGIIIGPLLLSILIAFLKLYKGERIEA